MCVLFEYLFLTKIVHDPKRTIQQKEKAFVELHGDWIGIKTAKKNRLVDSQIAVMFLLPEHRSMDFKYFIQLLKEALNTLLRKQIMNQITADWMQRKISLLKSFIKVIERFTANVNHWDESIPPLTLLDKAKQIVKEQMSLVAAAETDLDENSSTSDSEDDDDDFTSMDERIQCALGWFQMMSFVFYVRISFFETIQRFVCF